LMECSGCSLKISFFYWDIYKDFPKIQEELRCTIIFFELSITEKPELDHQR
jgi:hypothetical protein